jgi:Ni,Fe-hydrogenase I cytochrome b subunit
MSDDLPPGAESTDETWRFDVGPVTPMTWFWIFLMAFYVIATGVGLYFAMGNYYVTVPQGNWPLR